MAKSSSTHSEFEQISPTTWHVAVKVPSDIFVSEMDKIYTDLASNADIHGFRPGKAPRNILNKHFGKDRIIAETYENVIESTIWPALKEKEITIVGRPRIDFDPWTHGQEFNYQAVFEIVPPIPQIDCESYTVILPVREVTDEIMGEELRRLGIRLGKPERITDRPVREGDLALIIFDGEVPDVMVSTLEGDRPWKATNQQMEIEVGTGKALKGLDEFIVGMELEEIKEFEFILPDDFNDHRVRGKKINAKVRVQGIMKVEPVELNDETVKEKFGEQDIETLDDLKEKMRTEMEGEIVRTDGQEKADQLEILLTRIDDFPLPENLVRSKFAEVMDRTTESLKSEGKDIEDLMKEDDEKSILIRKRARYQAERMVRLDLLTREIARKESIGVQNEEIANYIMMLGMHQGIQEKDIKTLLKDPQFMDGTRNDILRKKVTSFLISKIHIERVSDDKYREHLDKTREDELTKEAAFVESTDDPLKTIETDHLAETLNEIISKNQEKSDGPSEEAASEEPSQKEQSEEPGDES